ncbi:MAG: hypothetical protein QMD12_01780 [Candidatus Aenigmarchaeota archaeon]|nr:hypothetical protein [Candidatus Aenigmarchaeota archaeon]
MVICIVALVVFSVLGIFSMRWREIAKEAFDCVYRMATFRPCITKLDQRIKSRLTAKLMKRAPALARFTYRYFKALSWIFTIVFFATMFYSAYGIYNLVVYGSCEPGSPTCGIDQAMSVISCYETQIVYGIILVLFIVFLYFGYRYLKFKE